MYNPESTGTWILSLLFINCKTSANDGASLSLTGLSQRPNGQLICCVMTLYSFKVSLMEWTFNQLIEIQAKTSTSPIRAPKSEFSSVSHPSLTLTHTLESPSDGSSSWVPVIHAGDPDWVPGSWIWLTQSWVLRTFEKHDFSWMGVWAF